MPYKSIKPLMTPGAVETVAAPAPAAETPEPGSFLNTLLGMGVRVGAPVLGGIGGALVGNIPGAVAGGLAGGAAGEAFAEKYIDPGKGELSPGRIAVAGALGSVPGSALGGSVATQALKGAGLGYAATAGNKLADTGDVAGSLNPLSDKWHGMDYLTGPIAGGVMGGVLGKITGGKKPTAAPVVEEATPKSVLGAKTGTGMLPAGTGTHPTGTGLTPADTVVEQVLQNSPEAPLASTAASGTEFPIQTPAPTPRPVGNTGTSFQLQPGAPTTVNTSQGWSVAPSGAPPPKPVWNMKDALQEARNEEAKAKYLGKETTQHAKNLNTRDKFVNEQIEQEASNLNARDKFVNADYEQEAKNQAARQQAQVLDNLRKKLGPAAEPATMKETVATTGLKGGKESATFVRGGDETQDLLGKGGTPQKSQPPAPKAPFKIADPAIADAFSDAANALGKKNPYAPAGKAPKTPKVPKPKTPTPAEPALEYVPEDANVAGLDPQAADKEILRVARLNNRKLNDPQQLVEDIVARAKADGYTGDETRLRAHIDDTVQMMKDIEGDYDVSGKNPARLIDAIADYGGISPSKERGKVPGLEGNVGELNKIKSFTTNGVVNGRRIIANSAKGKSLDDMVKSLRQDPEFQHITDINSLHDALATAVRADIDEGLAGKLERGGIKYGTRWFDDIDKVDDSFHPPAAESTPASVIDDVGNGEGQGRLPGAEGVRDVEASAAPVGEAPFSLDREVGKAPKGDQKSLIEDLLNSPSMQKLKGEAPVVNEPATNPATMADKALADLGAPLGDNPTVQEIVARAKAAGEKYGAVKSRKAAGEVVPEAERRAAGQEASAAHQALVESNPDMEALTDLPEDQLNRVLKDLVAWSKKGGGGTTLSAMGAGQGRGALRIALENPMMASRLAGGALGAGVGATQTPDDPLKGAAIGGVAGAIAPSAISAAIRKVRSNPNASPKDIAAVGDQLKASLNTWSKVIPDIQRFNLLSSPVNLGINAFVGPYGATVMAAIENIIETGLSKGKVGTKDGYALLKDMNPITFMNGMKKDLAKSGKIIQAASERAEGMGSHGPAPLRRLLRAPGAAMTSGDQYAKELLQKHGWTLKEAERVTLTSQPETVLGNKVGAFKNWGVAEGKTSMLGDLMLPFYKTAVNQIEQSVQRFPVLGIAAQYFRKTPDPIMAQVAQQVMGNGVGAGAFLLGTQLGDMDPRDPSLKIIRKFISNAGGQHGQIVATAFTAGQAYAKSKSIAGAIGKSLDYESPLPTTQPYRDAVNMYQIATGEKEFRGVQDLPTGAVPGFLTPGTPLSIPSVLGVKGPNEQRKTDKLLGKNKSGKVGGYQSIKKMMETK